MKKSIFTFIIVLCVSLTSHAQSSDIADITETIKSFSKAGDKNDAAKLATYLDDHYRIVSNRLFGSTEVAIMTKRTYLEKIRTKEYGGDSRVVNIEEIIINGNTASAKVVFKGTKLTFTSLIILIENDKGVWKLVNETPIMV